jgi:hypothetical protein
LPIKLNKYKKEVTGKMTTINFRRTSAARYGGLFGVSLLGKTKHCPKMPFSHALFHEQIISVMV